MSRTITYDSQGNDITCMKEFDALKYPCKECDRTDCEEREEYNMEEIKLNSHGVNAKIKYHILSDEKMKEIGFNKNYYEGTDHEEYSPYWWFSRMIQFPKDKRWRGIEIDFTVKIPKDGSDLNIMVLDDDFCQPYDYQRILSKNPNHPCASIVNEQVERWMEYLQEQGVLSGHVRGEYI